MRMIEKSTLSAAAARVLLATALGVILTGCGAASTDVVVEKNVNINTSLIYQ